MTPAELDADRSFEAVAKIKAITPVLEIVRAQTDMRYVALAWVSPQRWRVCAALDDLGLGLQPGAEIDIEATVCKEVILTRRAVLCDDALAHPNSRRFPILIEHGLRAYVSVPVFLANGHHFGNLCAFDTEPRDTTSERARAIFQSCAAILGRLLDEEINAINMRQELADERDTGDEREEFMAVVTHDLRNPLATVHTAAALLVKNPEARTAAIGIRLRASASRMTRLLDDLVDFSKGRAGKTMTVVMEPHTDLGPMLEAVVDEARDIHPDRTFTSVLHFPSAVVCDTARLQQVLSNLLGNAVAYGNTDSPIVVEGFLNKDAFHLQITNWGNPIPAGSLKRVFDAYFRGSATNGSHMGLGLSICTQIAKAHGGQLQVTSTQEEGTRFQLDFPLT